MILNNNAFLLMRMLLFLKKENYLWAIGGHGVDQNLIFKDKSTNEFLYFDRTGIWDAQGLNSPLLN